MSVAPPSPPGAPPSSAPSRRRRRRRRAIVIAILVAASIGGFRLWHDVLQDQFIPRRWGAIEAGVLYRSGRLSARLVEPMLEEHRIATVVNLSGRKAGDADDDAEIAAVEHLGIELVRYPLAGNGTGDVEHYVRTVAAMARADAEHPLLVHCSSGSQRTGAATVFYRLLVEGRAPDVAYAELERYDWDPRKNHDLVPYVNDNMAVMARRLVELGVIDRVPDPLPQLPVE